MLNTVSDASKKYIYYISLFFRSESKICSRNLKSNIKDVKFVSPKGSIQLIYKGQRDGDHFTVNYQVKNSKNLKKQTSCTRYIIEYIYIYLRILSLIVRRLKQLIR